MVLNFITKEKIPVDIFNIQSDTITVSDSNKGEIKFLHAIGCATYSGDKAIIHPKARELYGKNGFFFKYEQDVDRKEALLFLKNLLVEVIPAKLADLIEIRKGLSKEIVESDLLAESILNISYLDKKLRTYT